MLYFCVSRIFDEILFLKLWTIKINNIFHKWCVKPSKETFLKKIEKIQFFEENQCRTMLYFCVSRIFDEISFLKLWTIKINNIFHKWCVKPSKETFLKKIEKIQFFEENQCRTMLYFCVSRIFDEISFLKLWTIKKIIKKWTKKSKDAHKFLNFYPKILIVWLLERA